MNDVVGAATVSNVSILYGSPGVVGGNDIVVVRVLAQPEDGVTPAEISVHLASRAAPTSLSVLAPAAPPPPPVGGGPITIPFIIRNIPVHVPHGPWHMAGEGTDGAAGTSGAHTPWLAGSLTYFGLAGGLGWLDLFATYSSVESGTYTFRDASGNLNTVTISCDGAPCPRFKPLPSSGSPPAPPGGVGFDAIP